MLFKVKETQKVYEISLKGWDGSAWSVDLSNEFPSPNLGLSLKSCPCKSAYHKVCARHLRRRPYQQTTCPKNNLPHTLQIHSASGAAQFHSKSFIQ